MKKQDQLFYLIKSLTKNELSTFRNSVSNKKNYMELFNAIERQDSYNENEIKELFKNRKFIRQLHVTKNYLIKQILKSLRNDNADFSINIKLNNLLSEIELLFQRELFDQCSFLIEKSIKIANEHEKNSYLVILLNWKSKINIQYKNVSDTRIHVEETIQQQRKYLKNALIENEYWKLTFLQFDYFSKSSDEKKNFYNNRLLSNADLAKTLRSKINFYHINYVNATTSGQPEKALEYLNRLIEILESHPSRIIEEPSSYITTLNNKVSLLLNIKQYDQIPETLEKIRSIPEKFNLHQKENIAVRLNLRTYNIELEMYRDIKDYIKAEKLIQEIEYFIKSNQKSITDDYIVIFYYQFAYIFFMINKYDNALSWTNKIFQGDFDKIRTDLFTYARFLNLMIHYELDNNIVLKYAVDATRKYLKRKRTLLHFEKVLLKFFTKISMARKDEHNKLFRDLHNNLFSKTDDKKKTDILDYIDFNFWITSKQNIL